MADNDQPTTTPNNVSRTGVPPSDQADDGPGHNGVSFNANDEVVTSDYVLQLEDEVQRLRDYKQRMEARLFNPPVTNAIPPPPKVCSFKTFMASKPSEYHGSSNPAVTLDWLRDVEKKFEVCRCEEEIKVPYAVQLLKGQAMTWWDSLTVNLTPQQRATIRWSDFYNEVCKQYCSDYDMARIRQEFIDLRKTNEMTIDELIVQFLEKLRFVQQWVPDDKTKIEHFVRTLPPYYRTTVRLAITLPQAFNLARSVDSDIRAREIQNKDKSSFKSSGDSSGKGKQKWQGNQQGKKSGNVADRSNWCNWCNRCKSRHGGPCTTQTYRCVRCGETGHEPSDCKYPNYVCWNCKREGHRAGQCPKAGKQETGMVGGLSSSGHKRKGAPSRAFQMIVNEDFGTEDVNTDMQKAP